MPLFDMPAIPDLQLGFVPSLEAMPLVEAMSGPGGWQMRPRPGCGNIIRGLLTNELQGGLVPLELFVTELLMQPGQVDGWAAVVAIQAMPVELAVGAPARKRIYPGKSHNAAAPSARLTVAVEAKRSLAKFQFRAWLSGFPAESGVKPMFRMLPLDLMLKGLEETAIDGMIAPTPWGMQAEALGVGKLDAGFAVGLHGQRVVLVCRREISTRCAEMFRKLPSRLARARARLQNDPAVFRAAVERMPMAGGPGLALFEKAAKRHPWPAESEDFIPHQDWLMAEMQNLAGIMRIPLSDPDIAKLAAGVVFAEPAGQAV